MKPQAIQDREAALNDLVTKHPQTIPVEEVARFLGTSPSCIRRWAYKTPQNPYAMGIEGEHGKHDYCRIDTLAFYHYHMKS